MAGSSPPKADSGRLAFHVYVLVSESTGRRYVGQTVDLDRRLPEHNTPAHNARKYTTKHEGPWILAHQEEYETRSEAVRP